MCICIGGSMCYVFDCLCLFYVHSCSKTFIVFLLILDGDTIYAVRNRVPDPGVGYTELIVTRQSCATNLLGDTNIRVYDNTAGICREYATIISEENLIEVDRFITFYPITGRGTGKEDKKIIIYQYSNMRLRKLNKI